MSQTWQSKKQTIVAYASSPCGQGTEIVVVGCFVMAVACLVLIVWILLR
jgi:hypothetical protein